MDIWPLGDKLGALDELVTAQEKAEMGACHFLSHQLQARLPGKGCAPTLHRT